MENFLKKNYITLFAILFSISLEEEEQVDIFLLIQEKSHNDCSVNH